MGHHQSHNPADYDLDKKFVLGPASTKYIFTFIGLGLLFVILGFIFGTDTTAHAPEGHGGHGGHSQIVATAPLLAVANEPAKTEEHAKEANASDADSSHGDAHAAEVHDAHAPAAHGDAHAAGHGDAQGGGHAEVEQPNGNPGTVRFWANLLINGYLFTAIGLLGLFFVATMYAFNAGWSVQFKRIAQSMSGFMFVGFIVLLVVFFGSDQMLYDWKDGTSAGDVFGLTAHKTGYLNTGFFVVRNIIFFALWALFAMLIRKADLQEDIEGGIRLFNKRFYIAASFILVFALTFSAFAWDWLMSLEVTWFSTMYGVYVFASCWVAFLSLLTLVSIHLKENGFLPYVNVSHFHDLARMVFGFSIFWAYIWFCQFLLIWYANIPEETFYFRNRLDQYPVLFFATFILNFILPFLILMSRQNNRHLPMLGFVCVITFIGHWLDLSIMVLPGTMKSFGTIGFMEIGMMLIFLGVFLYVAGKMLSSSRILPKNHPYLMESIDHHFTS